jgi:hypothetical protein
MPRFVVWFYAKAEALAYLDLMRNRQEADPPTFDFAQGRLFGDDNQKSKTTTTTSINYPSVPAQVRPAG